MHPASAVIPDAVPVAPTSIIIPEEVRRLVCPFPPLVSSLRLAEPTAESSVLLSSRVPRQPSFGVSPRHLLLPSTTPRLLRQNLTAFQRGFEDQLNLPPPSMLRLRVAEPTTEPTLFEPSCPAEQQTRGCPAVAACADALPVVPTSCFIPTEVRRSIQTFPPSTYRPCVAEPTAESPYFEPIAPAEAGPPGAAPTFIAVQLPARWRLPRRPPSPLRPLPTSFRQIKSILSLPPQLFALSRHRAAPARHSLCQSS